MIAQLDKYYLRTRVTKIFTRLISYLFFEGRPLTAPGRWFNPITFGILKLSQFMPEKTQLSPPVYVIGTGRSGTTILGKILSIHRNVGYLNEPKAIWHYGLKNDDLNGNFTLEKGQYRIHAEDVNEEKKRKIRKSYSAFSLVTGNSQIVDKYPELIFRFELVLSIFKNAKFILIARNGYDTALSIDGSSNKTERIGSEKKENWWGLNDRKWKYLAQQVVPDFFPKKNISSIEKFEDNVNRGIVEWTVTMMEAFELKNKYPQNILIVKYEDLVNTPEIVLNEISSFTGLNHDQKMIKFAQLSLVEHKGYRKPVISDLIKSEFQKTMKALHYEI